MKDDTNSIPDFGFVNNPEQRRNALLNKLDAFDKMLKVNATQGAINKLQFDIKDKVDKWVIDYTSPNIIILNKTQIINLIDNVINRLSLIGE